VSLACPWAHRTLIFRRLKGLEKAVGVSVVHPWMGPEGWAFSAYPGATPDAINGAGHLHEIYTRAGFAATQSAHERAVKRLFEALDWLEARLARQRYLVGATLTEADWRLFTTLVRFDAVYHTHFKCNVRRLVDYPNLWDWTRELYRVPGVAETVNMGHIKRHYYTSHPELNPRGLIPVGPELDFTAPAGRG
jgi:putative glutathione S-transferase